MSFSEEGDVFTSSPQDINYRLILLAKQKKDRAEQRNKEALKKKSNGSRTKVIGKRKRSSARAKQPAPKKAKTVTKKITAAAIDLSASEDDRPEEEIEREELGNGELPDEATSNDGGDGSSDDDQPEVDQYYKEAQLQEQSRIDKMIEEKRHREREQKDILLEYAHRGLVSGCTIVDTEIGYDGSFGKVIEQDPLALKLLKHKITYSEDSKYYYEAVASYGLWTYVGIKYIETRPGLLGGMFEQLLCGSIFGGMDKTPQGPRPGEIEVIPAEPLRNDGSPVDKVNSTSV